jgi:hypothetical protein
MPGAGGLYQSEQRFQKRRFAGAVPPNQCDDFSLAHIKRRVVKDVAFAAECFDAHQA